MPGNFPGIVLIMKEIVLLGSTGSIGTQTLEVARRNNIRVKAITANRNIDLLEQQAREFLPEFVAVADENFYSDIKQRLSDTPIKVFAGIDSVCEAAAKKCDMVVNAVVGMVGLEPTLSAINAHNNIGLANKETLVVGGELVIASAKANGIQIIPIDSEHSAIFQSLMGNASNKLRSIILTASGGPFFGYGKEQLSSITVEQALKHPNWSMGAKITIDSATLMNKGLELIEAVRLFGVSPSQIEIVVHRQSILHSAVEYWDGSIIGQLGVPDMRIPIQFALTYPYRTESDARRLSLTDIGCLTFEKPDENTFSCLRLAKKAVEKGGNMPCILNKANEIAVDMFLSGRISFVQISEIIKNAIEKISYKKDLTLEIIKETEKETVELLNY